MVSLWEDKSANSRDATLSMGKPVFNAAGGPSGKPTIEFADLAVMMHFPLEVHPFSQRNTIMYLEVLVRLSISSGAFWDTNLLIPTPGDQIIFFKIEEPFS